MENLLLGHFVSHFTFSWLLSSSSAASYHCPHDLRSREREKIPLTDGGRSSSSVFCLCNELFSFLSRYQVLVGVISNASLQIGIYSFLPFSIPVENLITEELTFSQSNSYLTHCREKNSVRSERPEGEGLADAQEGESYD